MKSDTEAVTDRTSLPGLNIADASPGSNSSPVDTILVDVRGLQGNRASFPAIERQLWSLVRHLPKVDRRIALSSRDLPPLATDILELFDEILEVPPYRPRRTLILTTASANRDLGALLPAKLGAGSLLVALAETLEGGRDIRRLAPGTLPVLVLAGEGASLSETLPPLIATTSYGSALALDTLEAMLVSRLIGDGTPYVLLPRAVTVAGLTTIIDALTIVNERSGSQIRLIAPGLSDPTARQTLVEFQRLSRSGEIVTAAALPNTAYRHLSRDALCLIVPECGFAGMVTALEGIAAGGAALFASTNPEPGAGTFPMGESERLADLLEGLLVAATRDNLIERQRGRAALANEQSLAPEIWGRILNALIVTPVPPALPKVRPRIGFLSIYPPQEVGVPVYSRATVNALAAHAEIDLWTEAAVSATDRKPLRALRHISDRFDPRDYDQLISVVGNHPIHRPVYELGLRHGAAMVLHDPQLLDFFWSYADGMVQGLIEKRIGRKISPTELQSWFDDRSKLPEPFLDPVIGRIQPPIVHSPLAKDALMKFYKAEALYLPVAIQHGFVAAELTQQSRARAKQVCGVDPKSTAIGTFGEVHGLKGDKQCIYAVRDIVDWGYNVKFYFVGIISEGLKAELTSLVRDLNLEEYVYFSDRISESRYMEYLQAMDLGIQLRKMPFGQVSGALLDTISAGLPTVASEKLADAIEAPDFVIRIPDVISPVLIANAVADAIDAGQHLDHLQTGWQEYVEEHSFPRYADAMISALLG